MDKHRIVFGFKNGIHHGITLGSNWSNTQWLMEEERDTVHFGIAWFMAPMVMAIWWFLGIIVGKEELSQTNRLWANSMDIYSSWQLNESRWSSDQDWWTERTKTIHVDFLQRNWVSFDSTLKGASIFLAGLRLKIWLHPLPSLSVTPRLSATWCIPPGCIQTLKLSSTQPNLCLEGPVWNMQKMLASLPCISMMSPAQLTGAYPPCP